MLKRCPDLPRSLEVERLQGASREQVRQLGQWEDKYNDLKEEIDMVWETNAQLQDALKIWMETKGVKGSDGSAFPVTPPAPLV